ncbi:MAG: MBL fold metallo-hydrolase [Elusimicrobiales bacterium]|nr:MBL fold metallo-hydrolase [Elusimicrobiales bacterium]
MKIKFWGTRGSVPVCGKEFLKYGGNTTCLSLTDKDGNMLIIDCGTGIRNLGKEIKDKEFRKIYIIFTHQHWDHVLGFPFFAPIYDKRNEIIMTGCSYSTDDVRAIVSKVMQPPGFPVKFEEIDARFSFITMKKDGIKINDIKIIPIELSHPNGGLGYRFEESDKKIVFLTDNELRYIHPGGRSFNEYVEFAKDCDILIADADYTEEEYEIRKTWGHSSYIDTLELAIKCRTKKLILFHHNQERMDEQIDLIVKKCRRILKKEKINIECFAAQEGNEFNL